MKARLAAALLVLAAVGVHLGLTSAYRAEAAAAADDFRRVRDERRTIGTRLAQKLRLEDAQRRAGHLPAAEAGLTPTRAARLQVVRTLEGSGMRGVRLGVTPEARSPRSVRVHLTGEGSFEDVLRFAGQMAGPGTGLLLEQVELDTQQDLVGLSIDAMGLARP